MEIRQEVRTFKIDMLCDACGQGYMRPTGMVLMSDTSKYVHRCNSCDAPQNFTCNYPHYECEVIACSS